MHPITPKSWSRTIFRPLNFASDWTNSPRNSTRREMYAFAEQRNSREYFYTPHRKEFHHIRSRGIRIKISTKQGTISKTMDNSWSPITRVTAWSNCVSIMTWTIVHDQVFASARRKDNWTVGTAVTFAFI
ncbi:hypothetical protein TNCV_3017981 [Trichonephila clavipes]|nr:hypothetical protein TNCV_3017981 [Trichonephila clavipes]